MNNFGSMTEQEMRQMLPLGNDLYKYVREGKGFILCSFLVAVLSNDFISAAHKADTLNLELLSAYVIYVAKYVPSGAIGKDKIAKWKGLDYYRGKGNE